MLAGRTEKVLWAIVESYIENADPIGSRYVTKKYKFGVSPATIRNIMADLEELGYLMQPHTSAGRVPTDMGYRFYVEYLLNQMGDESSVYSDKFDSQLENLQRDMDGLLMETTKIISSFSHYIAVASPPRTDKSTFHKIELINYKDNRIAVILITDEGLVRHKIIPNDFSLKQSDMSKIASYLNSKCRGMNFSDIRDRVIAELKKQKHEFDILISKVMDVCCDTLHDRDENVFISGLKEIVNLPDFSSLEKIKKLSEAIEDKHTIIKLIDEIMSEDGVQVVIGSEHSVVGMENLSMVVSSYRENDVPTGAIGIIGPTRMNYQSAITMVNSAAKFISRVLDSR